MRSPGLARQARGCPVDANAPNAAIRVRLGLLGLALCALLPASVAAQPATLPGFEVCASPASPVTGAVTLSADIWAEPGLLGVQFKVDGYPVEALDTTFPFEVLWSAASAVDGEHTITAETRYASGDVIESAPLRLTVANPSTFNRTLYVDAAGGDDSNDGLSPSTPWRTLDRANQAVEAGDTVLLRGTFTGEQIAPRVSGTASRPIRFTSAPGETAVLDGGLSGVAVSLSARSYVVVEQLRIQNVSLRAVLLADGANHNVLRGSSFTNTGTAADLWGFAVLISQSSDNLIERNEITNTGNESTNAGDGIWVGNGSSRNRILQNTMLDGGHTLILIGGNQPGDAEVGDNVVAGNTLSNAFATPLALMWMARRTLVERNRISDGARNGVNFPRPGIQINASENIIRYNEVFDNAGVGIHLGSLVFAQPGQDPIGQDANGNQIYHNVFYGNGTPGLTSPDALASGAALLIFEHDGRTTRDNLIANNIFFRNSGFPSAGAVYSVVIEHFRTPLAWPDGSLNGNQIRNNIILREPGAAGELAVLRVRRPDQGDNVDFNLAQFEALHAEAADNLEVDPRFTDETRRLFAIRAGSPAIDQGLPIAGVDFLGAAPDIGVFEADALVAAYGFDEGSGATTADASGNSRTATISGAAWTTHTPAGVGSALVFDGVDDRVTAGTVTLGPAFTLMAWVFNPSHEAFETIITVGTERALYLRSGVITFQGGLTFGAAISTNAWHHVAVVGDGATLHAYLDAAPHGTARHVSLPPITGALQIGAWIDGAASNRDFFGGLIDEARVYDHALAQGEIDQAMRTRVTP